MLPNKFSQSAQIIICIFLVALGLSAFGQQKRPGDPTLANLEMDIEAGKLSETEKPLLQLAHSHPNDPRVLELLGRLRLRQARLDESMSLYRKVLTLEPGFVLAKINYSLALIMAGDVETARHTLDDIDQSKIALPLTRLNLGWALMLAGEFRAAVDALELLPAYVRNGDALPVLAECYVQLGQSPKIDELISLAKNVWKAKPQAVVKLTEVLIDSGRTKPAIELLGLITKAAPKNTEVLVLLSKAEMREKDVVPAKAHLERAAMLQPQSAEVWLARAELEAMQGNPRGAVDMLKKASSFAPKSAAILSELTLMAIKANQAHDAVDAAEKLLALNSDAPESMYLFGAASLQNGNLDKAQASLERFTQLRPKDSRGCLALALTFAAQKDQIEPARSQLRHCLEIDPGNVDAKYQLGLSYKVQGDTARAIQYLEETIAIAPNYLLALRDLGAVYLQAGEEVKARVVLEKAVAVDPKDAETHFQLSRLYNLIGEPVLAKRHLEIFQKLRIPRGSPMQ